MGIAVFFPYKTNHVQQIWVNKKNAELHMICLGLGLCCFFFLMSTLYKELFAFSFSLQLNYAMKYVEVLFKNNKL